MAGAPTAARAIFAVAAAFVALAVPSPATADAAAPPLLSRFPEDLLAGPGANQLRGPTGIAVDQENGALYVPEYANDRISQFDPWGVFVKAWGWGVEDGSPEPQTCGPPEPVVSPPPGLCQIGIEGAGPGQFNEPTGVVVGPGGDVYVFDRNNRRIQKFDPSGDFLLMFGGEVNKTTNANLCTKADFEGGDECGAGVEGTADGFFTRPLGFTKGVIAIDADGNVYVADFERIQVFDPAGVHLRNIPVAESDSVATLARDPVSGDLYFNYLENFNKLSWNSPVYRIDSETGEVVDTLLVEAEKPDRVHGLTVDSDGNLLVIVDAEHAEEMLFEYSPAGELLIGQGEEFAARPQVNPGDPLWQLYGVATNSVGDVYVAEDQSHAPWESSISVYGPPPIAFGPPPMVPPVIGAQFATTVGTSGATVKAKINPRFWADTAYRVEFGLEDCEVAECAVKPAAPGDVLTDQVVNTMLTSRGIYLGGLSPDTTYHYRFVAQSGGGGPVVGPDRTFTTVPPPATRPACPNDAFRPAAAAFLPDCRAYEMVSPVDKNGADISVVFTSLNEPAGLNQVTPDGEALTYSAYRAFGEVESAPYASQYLATRGASGWGTKAISPPRQGASLYATQGLDSQYKGFSEDLCKGWLLHDAANSLAPGSLAGWPNLYRHDICAGGYQALAPGIVPTVGEVNEFRPEIQGFSADGEKAIFVARGKLTTDPGAAKQLYEVDGSTVRLVCVLPSGTASTAACSAGTGGSAPDDRAANVQHAISEDGSAIYWTAAEFGSGALYVRVDHTTTTQVAATNATFWGATAADGSFAIYSQGEDLRRFALSSKTSSTVATGFQRMFAVSEDAAVAYFVSKDELAAGGEAGELNLYRYEAGGSPEVSFVVQLTELDLQGEYAPGAALPVRHLARTTPDGGALVFMSRSSLTGYDNADAATGEPAAEVYLYRVAEDSLVCVSCNPTGARPVGRPLRDILVAAKIPAGENQLSFPRSLTDDGSRVFFDSNDPLALRDTNGVQDVYEWEALGAGNCTESAPGYRPVREGCVNLISSGESDRKSELLTASADGRDVYFKTESSLVSQDPGLVDIYDARAGGGYPPPASPPAPCLGEACQNPAGAAEFATPGSQTYVGPGNVRAACPKGKHRVVRKGKARCAKNKKHKAKNKKKGKRKHKRHRKHNREGRAR
ncbi:MAG: NHL repeat-containing protein [Solirubrobacterales bacterium]